MIYNYVRIDYRCAVECSCESNLQRIDFRFRNDEVYQGTSEIGSLRRRRIHFLWRKSSRNIPEIESLQRNNLKLEIQRMEYLLYCYLFIRGLWRRWWMRHENCSKKYSW